MPTVTFTENLQRLLTALPADVAGRTVREALDAVFATQPLLRGSVLDDQGRLREHVVVFIDGQLVEDRQRLTDPLDPTSELFVMQSLSGG